MSPMAGNAACADGDGPRHPQRQFPNCTPLPSAQALLQDHHTQGNGHQWIDEVSQGGIHHLIGTDRIDVGGPVSR